MVEFDDGEETFSSGKPPRQLPDRNVLSLMVLSGPEAGRHFVVDKSPATIGRGSDTDIHIYDPFISRQHAELIRDDAGTIIKDLGSRYGVYVEGAKIKQVRLGDGHRIQLSGDTVIRARFQDPKETELIDQMRQAAMTDALTMLHNRRYLMQRLNQEFSFAQRHESPISVLMIDLDHFKPINDKFGHVKGDEALIFIAEALKDSTRLEDIVARYGGDEFVVIARGYHSESVMKFAERLRASVEARAQKEGDPISRISLSIGVASYDPEKDTNLTVMDLLVRADSALYRSKSSGRNRVSEWPTRPESITERNELEADTLRLTFPPQPAD